MVRPSPAPPSPMIPAKVPLPLVIASVLVPRLTEPEPKAAPDRDLIEAPALRAEMSKMRLAVTLLEVAMLPSLPPKLMRSSSPAEATVVVPV